MVDRDYFPNPGCLGLLALIVLALASLACGTQIPTKTSTVVPTNTQVPQVAVSVAITSEPTEHPRYVTTAPLNVRSEPNADSTILGTLLEGTEVTIFVPIPELRGDDCYLGEWYETPYDGVVAYVCSLYVREMK